MSLRKDDIVILILNILIYLNKNPVIPVKPDITFTRATPPTLLCWWARFSSLPVPFV